MAAIATTKIQMQSSNEDDDVEGSVDDDDKESVGTGALWKWTLWKIRLGMQEIVLGTVQGMELVTVKGTHSKTQ